MQPISLLRVRPAEVLIGYSQESLSGLLAFGMVKVRAEFQEIALSSRGQCELMHLTRAKEIDRAIANRVRHEVNFMSTTAALNCQHKKEVVAVQLMHHVLARKHVLQVANPEFRHLPRKWLFIQNLSDRNVLHLGKA